MRKKYLAIGHALRSIIDFILPKRSRVLRAEHIQQETLPLKPFLHAQHGVHLVSLMEYREKPVEDLVRALKYDQSKHAAHVSARAILDYLAEELSERELFSQHVIVAPVPLHSSRMNERGYDQTKLIAAYIRSELAQTTSPVVVKDVLIRTRATKPQTHLPREERLKNMVGAFACTVTDAPKDSLIILFDDVTTTGATLLAAADAVKTAGFEPMCLALARA